jgi:5-methylcytosine-specific restriction endonuclease McrA
MGFFDDCEPRRTLGIRDKQILYRRANKRCENPACGRKIEFDEMQVGHKTAWSKGGGTTLKNSVCLCYRCNKLQGTDSWATFLKKQGVEDPKLKLKKSLQTLDVKQLKALAEKHHLKIKGKVFEDFTAPDRLGF